MGKERTEDEGMSLTITEGEVPKALQDAMQGNVHVVKKEQIRKAKRKAWWKKWGPFILKAIQIVAIIVAVGILLYYLFWIALIVIGLAAMGGGVSEGARESQAHNDALYQQRQDNIRRMQQQKIYDQQHRRRR